MNKQTRFHVFLFFLERQRGRARGGRGEEGGRERENPKQAPCSVQDPTWSVIPPVWDHDLSKNQQLDAQSTEPPRHLHTRI